MEMYKEVVSMCKEPYTPVTAEPLIQIDAELAEAVEREGEQVLLDLVKTRIQDGENDDEA